MRFWLACLVMLLGASCAHALVPVATMYQIAPRAVFSTPMASCQDYAQFKRAQYQGASEFTFGPELAAYNGQPDRLCRWQFSTPTAGFLNGSDLIGQVQSCPANSTAVTGGCQCGANFDESGGQCVPHTNRCTADAGKVKVTNWTVGFFRTPDDNDYSAVGPVNKLPASGSFCSGGCVMNVPDPGAPGWAAWRSQSPNAQGLYRASLDIPVTNSGTECSPGAADTPLSPTAPEPQCPGAVGEVNGKLGCYGTAQSPIVTTPTDRPVVPPIAGNPTAGAKPETGEGSGTGSAGRTPTNGNGGNAGGPAGAGQGGKGGGSGGTASGTGTTKNGEGKEEKDPCGAPGQAECSVKVNEKGTPNGAGTTYDTAKAKMDETKGKNDEQLQKAAGTGDKGFFEPVRSMFWSPPIAACETFALPQQVGGLQLDACGVVEGVRFAMAFVWAGAGLFLCFGMIKRSF